MNAEGDFLQQMQDVMRALQDAHADLESVEATGTAGGGLVRVTVTATPEVRRVDIAPEALDDADMLGDLVVVATNDALRRAADTAQQRLGGLGLPGLEP